MTNEEIIKSALDKVKKQRENFGFIDRFNVDENWEVMIALEKQIPKKPNRIEYVDGGAEEDCPNCGKRICMVFGNNDTFRWQMSYCCDCGQALKWDWNEGEEE